MQDPSSQPLRHIVTATDLSAPSRHAAMRAAALAQAHGAALTLVHCLGGSALDDLRRWLGEDRAAAEEVEADARAQLHALALELGARHGIAVAEQLAIGRPVELVTLQADASDADLIVTGTRGAGFFHGVVLGAIAERIAKRSNRPVLMVRQTPHEGYRRVLVPVDFSPPNLAAIATARQLAPEATLVLMHALELPYEGKLTLASVDPRIVARYREGARSEALRRLHELASAAGLAPQSLRTATPHGADPWMLVVQQEQEHDCDLVVIGRQGRHAVDEWLLGSTTRMVMAECSSDVLVVSRPAARPGAAVPV